MTLAGKPIEAIQESDLLDLINNKVAEGKEYEYKRVLPDGSDSAKKECLGDVSSFANTVGGHLIYGMDEVGSEPTAIVGLPGIDPDAEKLRLENMLRDGLEPRIPGIAIKLVPANPAGVIVMRIPKSWASPHMVKFQGHGRFYARNSAGKYALDVHELRAAFALSETTIERLRSFRADRLSKIIGNDTPVNLGSTGKIILHVVPMRAFDPTTKYDLSSLVRRNGMPQFQVLIHTARCYSYHSNFDGVLCYGRPKDGAPAHACLQIFRNGTIEYIDSYLLKYQTEDGRWKIPSALYEHQLLTVLPHILAVQNQLNVETPLLLMLSMVGVRGYTLGLNQERFFAEDNIPVDRDNLLIPEVMVEGYEVLPEHIMKPMFDMVWNACGWPQSMNYDDTGKWIGQRG